ncbi:hypothetical protein V7150_07875 [Neobacillus drentensis]|uniref:hypothetical protein n=1 Tax=Neobacillus drentensis TaxID=220684 RepID=UPI002FFF58EB
MKKTLPLILGVGLFGFGIFGLNGESGESKVEAKTRTNVYTVDGKNLFSSHLVQQIETPATTQKNNSENNANFKDESYSFSLDLEFVDFESNIEYKDEQAAKEHLQLVMNYLNDITKNGTDFSAAARLQNDSEWKKFVDNIANLKYNDFSRSEILNDLSIAGALILQVERHYDEPSLTFLYEVIYDLNSNVNGGESKFNVTRSFGNKENFPEVYKYLQSKI